MRKYFLTVLLCLCAVCLQAYQPGDITLGAGAVFSALGLGTDFGEVNVEDAQAGMFHDAKLGQPGWGAEVQAMYFLNERLAVGISFTDQYFSKDLSSGWELNVTTRMRNYMAKGQVFLNPQQAYKVYIPLGIGLAQTDFSMDFAPLGETKKHFKYTGFAYHVGLGVERAVSEHFSVGLEGRYNANRFHDSTMRDNADRVTVYPKANFFSVLTRVVYKI